MDLIFFLGRFPLFSPSYTVSSRFKLDAGSETKVHRGLDNYSFHTTSLFGLGVREG